MSSAPIKPGSPSSPSAGSNASNVNEPSAARVSSTDIANETRFGEQRFDALQAALNFVSQSLRMEQGLLGRLLRILPGAMTGPGAESSSPMLDFRARRQAHEEASRDHQGEGSRASGAGSLATANAVKGLGGQRGQGQGQRGNDDQPGGREDPRLVALMAASALDGADRPSADARRMQKGEVALSLFAKALDRDVRALVDALRDEPEIARFAEGVVSDIQRAQGWANQIVPLARARLLEAGIPQRHPELVAALVRRSAP